MATRQPFWKWRHWKSIGYCIWPPSTCIWNLKLKFQRKLDLCSRNHVVYRQMDGQMDGRTRWIPNTPLQLRWAGVKLCCTILVCSLDSVNKHYLRYWLHSDKVYTLILFNIVALVFLVSRKTSINTHHKGERDSLWHHVRYINTADTETSKTNGYNHIMICNYLWWCCFHTQIKDFWCFFKLLQFCLWYYRPVYFFYITDIHWHCRGFSNNDILVPHVKFGGLFFINRWTLTHWGRDKWLPFSRRHFQTHFLEWKIFEFWLKFHWSLFLRFQLTIFQHEFR